MRDMTQRQATNPRELTLHIGHDELVIRQRYEVLSIANDILIGLWFVIGSALFFQESTTYAGTWLFLIGSIEMLIRPLIRLVRRVHLQRLNPGSAAAAGHDF
ncbi:YrhK family protein [Salinicola avicenniae]|uniref:YrhK family protein n=1 Tax=Salinicola avicenniae TaxID=2916836 RepID=UPI002074069C|nr:MULTISPECIES: YrhK family protein [unclassified Salinicola]